MTRVALDLGDRTQFLIFERSYRDCQPCRRGLLPIAISPVVRIRIASEWCARKSPRLPVTSQVQICMGSGSALEFAEEGCECCFPAILFDGKRVLIPFGGRSLAV